MKRFKKKKKVVHIRKSQIKTSAMVIISLVVFCAYCASMVWQSNSVIHLDSEIRTLQASYEEAVRGNDDLQGQIMKSKNLTDVDYYASNVLGMVKASTANISYVSYNTGGATDVANGSDFMTWLSGLIK